MFSAHPLQPTVNAPPLNHSPQRSCSGMDKDEAARGCPTALQIPWDQRDTVLTRQGAPAWLPHSAVPRVGAPLPLVSRLCRHSTRCLHGTGVPTAPASLGR